MALRTPNKTGTSPNFFKKLGDVPVLFVPILLLFVLFATESLTQARGSLQLQGTSFTNATGNNGLAPGEMIDLSAGLSASGQDFFNVFATLTSTDPCVTMQQSTVAYGNIPSGSTASNSSPFIFSISSACAQGHSVNFILTMGATDYIQVTSFTVFVSSSLGNSNTNGLGASTYTCLDPLGKGYGVGPGCLGPDADPSDPVNHTGAQVIAKWGSLRAFLSHLGYNPTRIWFMAPAVAGPNCDPSQGPCVGNDATGVVNDPTHPYLTFSAINANFRGGDMLMMRDGWGGIINTRSGTQGNPTIIMSYPGEQAVFLSGTSVGLSNVSWVIVDGIRTDGSADISGGTSNGQFAPTFHDNIFRHIESTGAGPGGLGTFTLMNGLTNILVEDNVFHDIGTGGQHCSYIGAREWPNSNVTERDNICFRPQWDGMHFNGRFTNLHVDQNLIYDLPANGGINGMELQEGISNSFIRGNIILDVPSSGIGMGDYPGDCAQFGQGGTGYICPYDETGNVIENNIIWVSGNSWKGGYTGPGCLAGITNCGATAIAFYTSSVNEVGNLGGNTIRNNILVNYGNNNHYPPVRFFGNAGCDATCKQWAATDVFDHNIFFQADGNNGSGVIGVGPSSTYGYQPYTCAQATAVTTMTNCINTDPKFVAASTSFWNSVSSFNFNLQSSSPAIRAGTSTGAPTYDVTGNVFANPPSIGALEYIASTSSDTVPPSVPIGLTAATASSSQINLAWVPSTDNVGVVGYNIYRDGAWAGSSPTATFSDIGLIALSTHSYAVSAYDAAGNNSAKSGAAAATTLGAPAAPTGLTATAASSSQINLSWTASTDSSGFVAGYLIYQGSVFLGISTTTTYSISGLTALTSYSYSVVAFDLARNYSLKSSAASATTLASGATPVTIPPPDTTAPSVPSGLTATAVSTAQINLSWNASTDDVGVAGYKIYQGGVQIATTATNAYSNTGLTASTTYSYTISAYDAAGNVSVQSSSASATTQTASTGTTTPLPPTSPTGGSSSYPIGWTDLANTHLLNVCPSPSPGGALGCTAVIKVWSGATARTKAGNEQLIIWGGGHSDYYGNEVYALNLNVNPPTLTRQNNPSVIDMNGADTYVSDGLPVSRHTYGGLAYLPNQDRMFSFDGNRMPSGSGGGYTWTLDLSQTPPVWQKMYPTNGLDTTTHGSVQGVFCAYDPNTDSVLCNWGNYYEFVRYTYSNNTWTQVTTNNASIVPGSPGTVIDPKRKLMFFIGNGGGSTFTAGTRGSETTGLYAVDISSGSNWTVQNWTSQVTGCSDLMNSFYPGLAYDSALDRIVGYPGYGNSVYVFNPDTKTCTAQTFSNGPPTTAQHTTTGTNGRFQYFPTLDAFALVEGADSDAYILRLSNATTASTAPTSLAATAASSTQVNLSWAPSTESGGTVGGYAIFRQGDLVGTSATTSYADTGLVGGTTYNYTVTALDAGTGNNSSPSSAANVTTLASSGTSTPTVPTVLTVTAVSPTQMILNWNASTESGTTVVGYNIYRGGVLIATTTTPQMYTDTTYSDVGLAPGTTYSYTVSAFDPSGHGSAQSSAVNATTQTSSGGTPALLLGNPSGSGTVTIFDAALIAQYAVGLTALTPSQMHAGEVSGTETTPTIFDAYLIAQYAVGLITRFPMQS